MTTIISPVPGRVFPITEAADPVFAGEMVGPGVAIEPTASRHTAVAPVAGTIMKLHPHAYAIVTDDGLAVLVHLGIDTVGLNGKGFDLVAAQGDTVEAGAPIVAWDPSTITEVPTTVLVVALDKPAGSLEWTAAGTSVQVGDELFHV